MSAMDAYGPYSYAQSVPIPGDAVMVVFGSLIKAYAEEIIPEHDFSVPGRWGLRNKIISKRKDSDAWQELRRHEVSSAVSDLKEMIRKTDFNVLLKDEKNLTQPDINAMENWIKSVAGRDVANIVWVEWLKKNPTMNKIITDAKEKEAAASRAAASRAEAEAASRAAAAAEEEEAERLGVRTLEECKQTLARFKEENARLVDRLAELTGAASTAAEGGARKRTRKNRRRRSKRTRRH